MPKGPDGQKRPADVIGAAVTVMRIATGQEPETGNKQASKAGRAGGKARAKNLSPERRKEIARNAAKARFDKE